MTAPTKKVREHTKARDEFRCVAGPEGCFGPLEWQHREASGHGGRGVKVGTPATSEGVMLCQGHNQRAEGEEQAKALALGHKIRRFRGDPKIPAYEIPYYDAPSRTWYLPAASGPTRTPIDTAEARERLIAAGNIVLESAPKLTHLPTELREATQYGFTYVLMDAIARPFGDLVSRHVISLEAHGRQVAVYRSTREGEYLGWGWVEHANGNGRTEYRRWVDMRPALRELAKARGIG